MPNTVTTDSKNNARAIQFEASSNVKSAVLYADGRVEVSFRVTGKRSPVPYSYANFTEAEFDAWLNAPSAGKWFDANIKKRPDLHPIVPTPPTAPGELEPLMDARPLTPADDPKAEAGDFSRDPNLGVAKSGSATANEPVASAGELLDETHRKGGSFMVDVPEASVPSASGISHAWFTKKPGELAANPVTASNMPESILVDARRLYERYIKNSGGLAWDGRPCPRWEELGLPVQSHWCAVVLEARLMAERPVGGSENGSPLDLVYDERNRAVIALARLAKKVGWKVGVGQHDPTDAEWDPEWRTILFVDGPVGQLSWHLHDRDIPLLAGLPTYDLPWDGHSTAEKYERLARL